MIYKLTDLFRLEIVNIFYVKIYCLEILNIVPL